VSRCAIGIGSNLGDRIAHLSAAVDGIAAVCRIIGISSVYETAPVGGPDQGPFLNAVVVAGTARTPRGLLREMLLIERARGRARHARWGPRTLDLDLLVWDLATIDEPGLSVPHPRLQHRRFVIEPLLEVWPDVCLPDGSAVCAASDEVDRQSIARLAERIERTDAGAT
jgi:2-amino-4-hydroxy-6-hydroxymethyldihydropteridine diphosphokinase